MKVTYRPIEKFPGERTRYPKYSPFRADWSDTLQLLDKELWYLGAREVVFQLDLSEAQIRLDGMPRSDATPRTSAVVLAFESDQGPLQFATDKFTKWKDNVRAIALGLESLRRLERYGITQNAQQYTGWKQIGSGIEMGAGEMTFQEAALVVARLAGDEGWAVDIEHDPQFARDALYRDAAKASHPDNNGGDREPFQRLQEAMRVLGV